MGCGLRVVQPSSICMWTWHGTTTPWQPDRDLGHDQCVNGPLPLPLKTKDGQFDNFVIIGVVTTTYGATSDDKVVKLIIFCFHCPEVCFNICSLTSIINPIAMIRPLYDCLISIIWFTTLVAEHLYIETAHWTYFLQWICKLAGSNEHRCMIRNCRWTLVV